MFGFFQFAKGLFAGEPAPQAGSPDVLVSVSGQRATAFSGIVTVPQASTGGGGGGGATIAKRGRFKEWVAYWQFPVPQKPALKTPLAIDASAVVSGQAASATSGKVIVRTSSAARASSRGSAARARAGSVSIRCGARIRCGGS